MQDEKNEPELTLLDKELHRLIDTVAEVPYSAQPLERPQIFFIAGGSVERLTGYSAAEIYADNELWMNMIRPDDRERVCAAFAKCKSEGRGFEVEYRLTHKKDGSLRYVIDKGEPVLNDKEQITQIEGIITDVSKQRETEGVQVKNKIPKATNP